jgi:hypothetical protein
MGPIVVIDGADLVSLLAQINELALGESRLSVCLDEGGAKFKVGEGMWSPALGNVAS